MIETLKTAVSTIGIDIGKNWFHVVGLDRRGAIVLRHRDLSLSRGGRYSIDHAPGGRDDVCNAVCGSLELLSRPVKVFADTLFDAGSSRSVG